MTQAQVTQLTSDAVLYSLAASVAFLLFAALFDPKLFKIPIGRSLIVLDAGLVALYAPTVLHRFFGLSLASAVFAYYYLATILIVGSAVWWRTLIMARAQWRAARKG